MAHTCHAIGCDSRVPPEMFMCKPHWFSLPRSLRNRIWETYRPGQCDDWNISDKYAKAAKDSLIYIARLEHRAIDYNCPELRLYDLLTLGRIDGQP